MEVHQKYVGETIWHALSLKPCKCWDSLHVVLRLLGHESEGTQLMNSHTAGAACTANDKDFQTYVIMNGTADWERNIRYFLLFMFQYKGITMGERLGAL